MEQIAFIHPEDVKFIEQCFANRGALEAILDAKSVAIRVDKDAAGKIGTISEIKQYRNRILWTLRIKEIS